MYFQIIQFEVYAQPPCNMQYVNLPLEEEEDDEAEEERVGGAHLEHCQSNHLLWLFIF